MYDFKFADIGEGIHEGTILTWHVKMGDQVKEGDLLVTVETDKVNAELSAPVAGYVTKLDKAVGDVIHVGETVVVIEDSLSSTPTTPAPKKLVEENAAGVVGDIAVSSDIIADSSEHIIITAPNNKALATPVARAFAKELGVDINLITGSGPQGRVTKEDILAFNNNQPLPSIENIKPMPMPTVDPLPTAPLLVNDEIVKISRLRKAIATQMTKSKENIPHCVLLDEFNVDALVAFRNQTKDYAQSQGIKLTFMAFIAKAVIIALKEFPIFNAVFKPESDEILLKKGINLGIAVDTKDGLIVPNIKTANNLSILELAGKIRQVADETIARKVALELLQNGTFTITNFGAAGLTFGTPIINYPETAILGIGKIEAKPVVKDGQIVIANTLPLSLAIDHRIIDGADGGRFLLRIKELLTNPAILAMQ